MMNKKAHFFTILVSLFLSNAFVNGFAQAATPSTTQAPEQKAPVQKMPAQKAPVLIAKLPDSFKAKKLHLGDALITPDKKSLVIPISKETDKKIQTLEKTQGPSPTLHRVLLVSKNISTPAVLMTRDVSTPVDTTKPIELSGTVATPEEKTFVWNYNEAGAALAGNDPAYLAQWKKYDAQQANTNPNAIIVAPGGL